MADIQQTRLVPHIATSTTGSKRVSKAMTVGPEEIPTCLDHSWIWLVLKPPSNTYFSLGNHHA